MLMPLFENWEITYDEILETQDKLGEYTPPFNFSGHDFDYEQKNDGSGDYTTWIEFTGVDIEFIEKLDDPDFYNRQAEHFSLWAAENGYEFYELEILSTEDSVTYSVTVDGNGGTVPYVQDEPEPEDDYDPEYDPYREGDYDSHRVQEEED